jgi:hypothetical protein
MSWTKGEKENLLQYGRLVQMASKPDSPVLVDFAPEGWTKVGTLNDLATDTQAVVLQRPDEVAVVFPCTKSVKDVGTDCNIAMVKPNFGKGWTHKGCALAVKATMAATMEIIERAQGWKETRRLTIIGYSLGGGLATLYAAALKMWYLDRTVTCVTFGALRVGDSGFADFWNSVVDMSWRFVYEDDIVTKVPFHSIGWPPRNYCAVRGKQHLGVGGWFREHPSSLWGHITATARSAWSWVVPGKVKDKFSNHNIDLYLAAMEKATTEGA